MSNININPQWIGSKIVLNILNAYKKKKKNTQMLPITEDQ